MSGYIALDKLVPTSESHHLQHLLYPSGPSSPMLILLFLSKQSIVAQGYTLQSRDPADNCDGMNNCRRLFDIAWGCLATIFACTWVSVHPNVPPPNQTRWSYFGRRLGMMLVAVIAPEVMVGFAARQFWVARDNAKKLGVSKTHGFFICMGGFVTRSGRHPIVDVEVNSEYHKDMVELDPEDLMDKSKGDALSKGVAASQCLWFITQYLARIHQRLPVTELEVTTLAFSVVNIFTWLLWWNKPLDVARPLLIGPNEGSTQNYHRSSPLRSFSWRECLDTWLRGPLSGWYGYFPDLSTAVPTFWSSHFRRFNHPIVHLCAATEAVIGIIFGAIHLTAWNAQFPSVTESWMWRICSLSVTVTPAMTGILLLSLSIYHKATTNWGGLYIFQDIVSGTSFFALIPLYILSRLFLIVLPFTTVRAIPRDAYINVDWSVYIPHV